MCIKKKTEPAPSYYEVVINSENAFRDTDLLPSAEEAVADICVWTVHSDTNALMISVSFTSDWTFIFVLTVYRYSHDHPCASRQVYLTQRGHCF